MPHEPQDITKVNYDIRGLWAAVLLRAVRDIMLYRKYKNTIPDSAAARVELSNCRRDHDQAVAWIKSNRADAVNQFRSVCGMLNVSADKIRREILEGKVIPETLITLP